MSEYQYYEFQAIDRPLSGADQEALRALSTRARISATSFTNSYEWGDFKGDPARLMENWFELHLYLANWGSRRLMIRWPARLLDRHLLGAFLGEVDYAELRVVGQNLILDIVCEEVESEDWDDGSGWLAALAPLRSDVLGGDLRLFYLLWLTAVEAGVFEPDEPEPMPGIGPMTGALEAFADFFNIDPDLVAAAAERSADPLAGKPASSEAVQPIIAAMTDHENQASRTVVRRRCARDERIASARPPSFDVRNRRLARRCAHCRPIACSRRRDPARPRARASRQGGRRAETTGG
jgi:hypothetical protein